MPRLIAFLIRAASRVVPEDARADWRREWEAELEWARRQGRSGVTRLGRALGAWPHALWLRADRWRWDVLGRDLRYATRSLAARPGFTLIAIASLALGIGANIAIFTVVNGVLLRPLPFPDASRIVQLANGDSAAMLSGPEFVDLSRDAHTLTAFGAYAFTDANVTGGRTDPERVRVARVTAGFFTALGTSPAIGRAFAPEEDQPGGPGVVVVSQGLWNRYVGAGEISSGRQILLNGAPRTIVGVMPAGFDFPSAAVEVWVPLALNPADPGERRNHNYRVIARLAGDADVARAQAEVTATKAAWQTRFPDLYGADRPLVADVITITDRLLGTSRPYLVAMLGAVALVLMIACVNVASLLLTYGEARRKDLAICAAMGASRGRLATRTLAESVLLTAGGGAVGLFLAVPASRVLVAVAPASIPRLTQVHVDPAVLAFAALVSLVTALVSSAMPLIRVYRDTGAAMLRSAGRSAGPAGGLATRRAHAALVIGQVALAVTMLAGAGYFTRSLLGLQRTDLGFNPQGVLTARLTLPRAGYDEAKAAATIEAVVERLRSAPGVSHAAAMAWTPIVDGGGMWSVVADAVTPAANRDAPVAAPQQVTPDFFEAMSIPILRGRAFTTADKAGAEFVGIVNESFSRLLWGSGDPIGRRFRMLSDGSKWITVVGLVPDTRVEGLTDAKLPVMYVPHAQAGESTYFTSLGMTLAIRHAGDAAPLVAEIRRVVHDVDANVPLSDIRGLDDVVGASIARERFTTVLVAGFAVVAALLTGVGLYGVIAYGVAQRRFEIGVRMALGAAKGRILAEVVRRGVALAGAGLALGLVGAIAVGVVLRSTLVGVAAFDAGVLGLVSILLFAVALAAIVVPARRAIRVSPTEALINR